MRLQCCLLPLFLLGALTVFGQGEIVLESNLNSTARNHICSGETIVLTCSGGIGTLLAWSIGGTVFLFRSTADISMIQFANDITTYLIRRDNVGNGTLFQYTSKALLEVSGSATSVVATCVAEIEGSPNGNQIANFITDVSALPRVPLMFDRQVNCIGRGDTMAFFPLSWKEPVNIDSFDLDYYEVTMTTPNGVLTQRFRSISTSAIISANLTRSEVMVDIVAVSRCGQKSVSNTNTVQLQCNSATTLLNSSLSVVIALLCMAIGASLH